MLQCGDQSVRAVGGFLAFRVDRLILIYAWRESRKLTKSLTVQYDRVMYLLDDTLENRKLIDRYIEVWEYPDGRKEIRANGRVACV